MATETLQLEKYKRFLLNRSTTSSAMIETIENCLATEDKPAKQLFHKIMIHNWQDTLPQLFDRLSAFFGAVIIPVNSSMQGEIATFYTSNLNFILRLIKQDFLFPYCRSMFNVDVLFNYKNAVDYFGTTTTLEDIISGVVSRRFREDGELDLSNFCEDPEFVKKKITFYKITLLAQFKILMIRMGRDTKSLNLSHNNLSQVPFEVLNFFIKADLTTVNLSYNNIPSITEILRVSSKIEKLYLEGNPLCENLDAITYVKTVTMKFPRLIELDGIKLNQHGVVSFPFFRNYLVSTDSKTKSVVEKFVTLYFANYDQPPKMRRNKIVTLYDDKATLTISCDFLESDTSVLSYTKAARNFLTNQSSNMHKTYKSSQIIANVLSSFPESDHDLSTFTVDVLIHDQNTLYIIIDGLFRERNAELYFQFRRTFVFSIYTIRDNSVYQIKYEMFNLRHATTEQIERNFKHPVRNMNALTLMNPSSFEVETLLSAFQHLTNLRRPEAEMRLKFSSWDIRDAIKLFLMDTRNHKLSADVFLDIDSDISSLDGLD
ncbi:nuclear RNA export factor 2-like [Trichoplusia ni]|uniref:Nuclear RNA export factor 2-like n=1 Tax=Trichoplusia ni TaxID=7111 RepID=A0A7E5W5D0_TRINI|nr:nuclear RNA export factor 2-like [Trichoplusia ni]